MLGIKRTAIYSLLFIAVNGLGVTGTHQGSSNDDFDYPCGEQANICCIRNYFVNTGRCNEVTLEDGQPIAVNTLFINYVPTQRLKETSESNVVTFYGSKITAFYVNRQTNNLVFSLNFDGINNNSSLTTFTVSQRGKEPAVESTYLNKTYSAEITAIIPCRGESGLEGTTVTVINNNPIIPYANGPELAQSKEPAIRAMFAGLVADIPSALEQLLLTEGPYFFYTYLQNYICDFGFVFNGAIV